MLPRGEVRIITDDPIEVPIMLLPKPFVLLYQHNSKQVHRVPLACELAQACAASRSGDPQEKSDNLVTIDEETGPSSNHHGSPV